MRATRSETWSPALASKAPQATGRPLGSSLGDNSHFALFSFHRRAVYSTPPNRPLDSYLDDEVAPPSHCVGEVKANNIKIISDVEKESIQAELAGIEEVYQRVCQVSE